MAGLATCKMSNLRPESTGLPFMVFIPQRDDARHATRVTWSPQPRVKRDALGSYAGSPFGHKAEPRLGAEDGGASARRVELSLNGLQRPSDGALGYARDAVEALKRV